MNNAAWVRIVAVLLLCVPAVVLAATSGDPTTLALMPVLLIVVAALAVGVVVAALARREPAPVVERHDRGHLVGPLAVPVSRCPRRPRAPGSC